MLRGGFLICCLVWMSISLLVSNSHSAELQVDKADEARSCVSKADDEVQYLSLPAEHFSFAQRSYLSELCSFIYLRRVHLKVEANRLQFKLQLQYEGKEDPEDFFSESAEELDLLKRLNDIELQSVSKLASLLRQAIKAPSFDEEAFWKSWQQERRQHAKEASPLRKQSRELLLERAKRGLESHELKKLERPQ